MDRIDPNTVRCPTCRAVQEWSDVCRRCKSDLRLLRSVAEDYLRSRRECLIAVAAGRAWEARVAAARCHELHPDAESQRLVALGALLGAHWETAAETARRLLLHR